MKRLFLALMLALTLTGCAGTKVGDLLSVATTTITNPVTATNIYQVKNGYAAALQLAVSYRSYCYSKPYADILKDAVMKPVCQNRRSAIRSIQKAQVQAHNAIFIAEQFVKNNPTLDATSVITAAWNAVSTFKNAVPATN